MPTIHRPLSGLYFQPRDYALLETLLRHRYARSDHLARLLFAGRSLRVCQGRLKKLRDHGFVERYRLTAVWGDDHEVRGDTRPVYCLGERGAELLAERLGRDPARVPHGFPWSGSGVGTLEHHLLVTDFLVAIACAARERSDVELTALEHEWILWQRLDDLGERPRAGSYLVPDGAVTLTLGAHERLTYYLELVRAGFKGGNSRLKDKLTRYLHLLRSGFFRATYGHERVRAVLFLTSSKERAKNLRQVAATLPHGQQLFWFGTYATAELEAGSRGGVLTPISILEKHWQTAGNESVSLIPQAPGQVLTSGAPDIQPHHETHEPQPDVGGREGNASPSG